jgi:hypothetical protein
LLIVIVWINGAFGAGKSTVTAALRAARPQAREFDPEYVGYVLRRFVDVPTGDFQDLPLWRSLTVKFVAGLARAYPGTWVVPMTLLRAEYRAEILGGLRARGVPLLHVVLQVPEPVLRARIDADAELAEAREWRQAHVAEAMESLTGLAAREPFTIEIGNGQGTRPEAVAEEILRRCGLVGCGATRPGR